MRLLDTSGSGSGLASSLERAEDNEESARERRWNRRASREMNGSSKIKNRTARARNRNNELTLVASCTHGEGCRAQWALNGPKRKQSGEEEQVFQSELRL